MDEINKQNMSLNADAWIIMGLEKQKAAIPSVAKGLASLAVQRVTTKEGLHWVEGKVLLQSNHTQGSV